MKVLRLNTYFLLPDDFAGDVNDALSELIKYRKAKGLTAMAPTGFHLEDHPECTTEDEEKLWADFYAGIAEGYRHVGGMTLAEYLDGKWVVKRSSPVIDLAQEHRDGSLPPADPNGDPT